MQVITRSQEVRTALTELSDRLPSDLWQRLSNEVFWLRGDQGYERMGLNRQALPTAAALYPLWEFGQMGNRSPRPEMQIFVFHPVFRRFGHTSRIGILAHEFAHVHDAMTTSGDWHAKMRQRYERGEKAANRLATAWGFGKEIRNMQKEREHLHGHYWSQLNCLY